jgi:hypothetical protein
MIKISHDPDKSAYAVSTVLLRKMLNVPDSDQVYVFDPPITTTDMAKHVEQEWYRLHDSKTPTLRTSAPDQISPMVAFKSAVTNMPPHFIYEIENSHVRYYPKPIPPNVTSLIYIILILLLMIWYGYYVTNRPAYIGICFMISLIVFILFYTYRL